MVHDDKEFRVEVRKRNIKVTNKRSGVVAEIEIDGPFLLFASHSAMTLTHTHQGFPAISCSEPPERWPR